MMTAWAAALALGSTAVAATPTTGPAGTPFHSAPYGYTFTPPAGWVEIPHEVIVRNQDRLVPVSGTRHTFVETGFQPAFLRAPLGFPRVLICVTRTNAADRMKSTEEELQSLAPKFASGKTITVVPAAGPPVGDWSHQLGGQAIVDLTADRLLTSEDEPSTARGPVHGVRSANLGRDALVVLDVDTYADDWEQYAPDVRAAIDSFQFDTVQQRGAPAAPPIPNGIAQVIGLAIAGVGVAFGLSVASWAGWIKWRDHRQRYGYR